MCTFCQKEDESLEHLLFHCTITKNFWLAFSSWISEQCLGAGSRQYCRYNKSPLGITPLKEIWESPWVNENLTSVGFEPTTSNMLYRLSYEASTGAGRYSLPKLPRPAPVLKNKKSPPVSLVFKRLAPELFDRERRLCNSTAECQGKNIGLIERATHDYTSRSYKRVFGNVRIIWPLRTLTLR